MKNIHVLPTDKPSKFVKDNVMYDYYFYLDVKIKSNLSYTAQNIYITNDEEIREGDYVTNGKYVSQAINEWWTKFYIGNPELESDYWKIILTTDQDLIKDGVQEIPEYFLIHYIVGNNPIEYVEIKEHLESIDTMKINYELIIPKEEPKERLKKILGTKHPKQEINLEDIFNEEKKKGVKELIDKHKQETLEDKLDKIVSKEQSKFWAESDERFKNKETLEEEKFTLMDKELIKEAKKVWKELSPNPIEMALFGAKWQQEQIGKSEFLQKLRGTLSDAEARRLIFETFNK